MRSFNDEEYLIESIQIISKSLKLFDYMLEICINQQFCYYLNLIIMMKNKNKRHKQLTNIHEKRKCLQKTKTYYSASSYKSKQLNSQILLNSKSQYQQIIDYNIYLRKQNSQLKKNFAINTSAINRKQTPTFFKNTDTNLVENLYQSNKALQQTIIKLNDQAKQNETLKQEIIELKKKNEQLKNNLQNTLVQFHKIKNKLKKSIVIINDLKSNKKKQLITSLHHNKIQNSWVHQTNKKLNSIQQNISKIQQTHDQFQLLNNQLNNLQIKHHQQNLIVLKCEDYIHKQFMLANQQFDEKKSSEAFFPEIHRMNIQEFQNPELKDIIQKLDISKGLSQMLNGFIKIFNEYSNELQNNIFDRLIIFELKLRNNNRKISNICKLIKNKQLKLKSKLRNASLQDKENIFAYRNK